MHRLSAVEASSVDASQIQGLAAENAVVRGHGKRWLKVS